jgi:quercetin dioxygenase-like cupin family protein
MRHAFLALALLATPAAAQPAAPVSRTLATIDASISGQPIVAAPGKLQVTVSEATIPPGARLPPHKHPYVRIGHVVAGRLKVTNHVTGAVVELKAGDWIVDPIDQWHEGEAVGSEPVRLLIIDQGPPGAQLTVPRNP